MKRHQISTLIFYLFLILFMPSLFASKNNSLKMPTQKLPITVKIGFYLNQINRINQLDQSISFIGTLFESWQDKSLSFDKEKKDKILYNEQATTFISKIWHPTIVQHDLDGHPVFQGRYLKIKPNGVIEYLERYKGIVYTKFNFRKFPFDVQHIQFTFEPFRSTMKTLRLKVDPLYVGQHADNLESGWVNSLHTLPIYITLDNLNRVKKSTYATLLTLKREPWFYVIQILLPMMIITIIPFSVFWMQEFKVINRISIGLTCFLSILVFQWQLQNLIPPVSYSTLVLTLLILSIIIIALKIILSIIMDTWVEVKQKYMVFVRFGVISVFVIAYISTWLYFMLN